MDIKNPLKKMKEIVWVPVDVWDYVESIDILLSANIDYEFRTTVIKWVHSDQDMEKIVQSISWAKNYYIQNYRPWNTLKQNFIWESFLESELDDFKNIAEKYVESVWIRS
jgi:pyruvate formate lyase activating enzyme